MHPLGWNFVHKKSGHTDRHTHRRTHTQTNWSENITPPRFCGGVKQWCIQRRKDEQNKELLLQLNTPVDNCGNIAHPGERPTSMQKVSTSNTSYMQSFTSHDKINIKNKLSLYIMTRKRLHVACVWRTDLLHGSRTLPWMSNITTIINWST